MSIINNIKLSKGISSSSIFTIFLLLHISEGTHKVRPGQLPGEIHWLSLEKN